MRSKLDVWFWVNGIMANASVTGVDSRKSAFAVWITKRRLSADGPKTADPSSQGECPELGSQAVSFGWLFSRMRHRQTDAADRGTIRVRTS